MAQIRPQNDFLLVKPPTLPSNISCVDSLFLARLDIRVVSDDCRCHSISIPTLKSPKPKLHMNMHTNLKPIQEHSCNHKSRTSIVLWNFFMKIYMQTHTYATHKYLVLQPKCMTKILPKTPWPTPPWNIHFFFFFNSQPNACSQNSSKSHNLNSLETKCKTMNKNQKNKSTIRSKALIQLKRVCMVRD